MQFGSKVTDTSSVGMESRSRSSSVRLPVVVKNSSHKRAVYEEALEQARDANEVDLHMPGKNMSRGIVGIAGAPLHVVLVVGAWSVVAIEL